MTTISHDPLQVDSSPIHDLVSSRLSEMTSDVKADDKFIVCLHKIQLFYPQFSDRYVIVLQDCSLNTLKDMMYVSGLYDIT